MPLITNGVYSFQVVVKGTNGTIVINRTLSPDANDMTLTAKLSESIQLYTIQIAAENEVGLGPFSDPLKVEFEAFQKANESDKIMERRQQIWVIGATSAALFVLILISAVLCYKRKLRAKNKPLGYLAASTTDDIHCQLSRGGPIIKNDSSLWIDRRWGSDSCEKDSNSSEKKLLKSQQPHSNSNSDTEYAYVENRHNVSVFTNSSSSRKNAESPEPYATTEIFQRHYAAPVFNRNVHSCDNLTEHQHSQHYAQHIIPHNYQRSSMRNKPRNLLDMIPPPPIHPPPPSIYNKSQESVISPKYLFAHPMYQGTTNNQYRVAPVQRSHYEQVNQRLVFDRDCHDELENFNAMLGQFHHKSDAFSTHCEADNESEEDEGSSLTSHKSNHY